MSVTKCRWIGFEGLWTLGKEIECIERRTLKGSSILFYISLISLYLKRVSCLLDKNGQNFAVQGFSLASFTFSSSALCFTNEWV